VSKMGELRTLNIEEVKQHCQDAATLLDEFAAACNEQRLEEAVVRDLRRRAKQWIQVNNLLVRNAEAIIGESLITPLPKNERPSCNLLEQHALRASPELQRLIDDL
jgi:hypothetical protein